MRGSSFALRAATASAVVMLVLSLLGSGWGWLRAEAALRQQLDLALAAEADGFLREYEEFGLRGLALAVEAYTRRRGPLFVALLAPDGRPIAGRIPEALPALRGFANLPGTGERPSLRVLGGTLPGGATLPVYYLASQGVTVHSYDIDRALTAEAQAAAQKHGWPVVATTQDLTSDASGIPASVDWILSFCVLEHLPRELQLKVAGILAGMLRPGGWLTVTFDYSPDAPVEGALRSPQDVQDLIDATGLIPADGVAFHDTGERFVLDRKYPDSSFTFGSLFLRKPPL